MNEHFPDNVRDIIHDTIYSAVGYPHIGNDYVLAANWILNNLGIKNIDSICRLAKTIEKHSTYDHEISLEDLYIILDKINIILRQYKLEKLNKYNITTI